MAAGVVEDRLRRMPAATIVGPRQSGKTTLALAIAGSRSGDSAIDRGDSPPSGYFDLEQDHERLRLDLEWSDRMHSDDLLILDEAQSWPEIMPRLRGAIDADRRRNGRFLLLGSVSPSLMLEVSESLAGRMAMVELTPLLFPELAALPEEPAGKLSNGGSRRPSLREVWFFGGYPEGGVLDTVTRGSDPAFETLSRWQRDYLHLLAARDLPQWGLPAKPQVTQRLFQILASVNGQIWNASAVGRDLSLTHPTVSSYLDYLEGAYLLRRLPAFAGSQRKRLARKPKVYWRDNGLLHSLLRVRTQEGLIAHDGVGASWEGFVIEQVLSTLAARDLDAEAWFYRDHAGLEVDLVVDLGSHRWAIEIKLSSNPSARGLGKLRRVAADIHADRRALVSMTDRPTITAEEGSCNLAVLLEWMVEESR